MSDTPIKTALITGSGQNIGKAIALHLAKSGFNVIVNGSQNETACQAVADAVRGYGQTALVVMGDVGQKANVDSIAQAGIDKFGSIDVVINNAAIRPHANFLDISEDQWQRVMDVNMNAAVWLARACLPGMQAKGWGRFINFSGMNAQRGYPGAAAVSVSKHAAWGFAKAIAVEFGRDGVTANVISPGTFPGDDVTIEAGSNFDKLRAANPSGRLGKPNDIAAMVGYLCSDDGGFVNGQILQINGGVVMQF